MQNVNREERASSVGLKREARASSVGTRPGRRALVSSVKREASSAKRWYEALIVEREASVGTVREASIKRAFAQERKAKREASIGIEHCVWAALRAALHNVEHYVDIGVKRKCQVLLVSSVAQSAGVLASGLQYVLTCVVKHKCRSGGSSESRIVFSYVLVIGST